MFDSYMEKILPLNDSPPEPTLLSQKSVLQWQSKVLHNHHVTASRLPCERIKALTSGKVCVVDSNICRLHNKNEFHQN